MAYLPGQFLKPEPNSFCEHEDHQGRPAVKRMVGETDSFSSEFIDMCQECYDAAIVADDPMANGECDWCMAYVTTRVPTRDADEGSSGPVYYVCKHCRVKQNKEAQEELEWDCPSNADSQIISDSYNGSDNDYSSRY